MYLHFVNVWKTCPGVSACYIDLFLHVRFCPALQEPRSIFVCLFCPFIAFCSLTSRISTKSGMDAPLRSCTVCLCTRKCQRCVKAWEQQATTQPPWQVCFGLDCAMPRSLEPWLETQDRIRSKQYEVWGQMRPLSRQIVAPTKCTNDYYICTNDCYASIRGPMVALLELSGSPAQHSSS